MTNKHKKKEGKGEGISDEESEEMRKQMEEKYNPSTISRTYPSTICRSYRAGGAGRPGQDSRADDYSLSQGGEGIAHRA